MCDLEIGSLLLTFYKTVRVRDNNEISNLPPNLGEFDVYKVADYENCPKNWDKEAYFIAMQDKEAMWMGFQCLEPISILIGTSDINALSGKKFENKLEKGNYMTVPPQPWLDGWKGDDGSVYQFVATKTGENKTVGEQILKTTDHSLIISVFKAKNPKDLKFKNPSTKWGDSEAGNLEYAASNCCRSLCCSDMGLGKGGKIKQKVYEDPYGVEAWQEKLEKSLKVYLINALEFSCITGMELPVSAENYNGTWYGLDDDNIKDLPGSEIFKNLKSAI